MQTLMPVTETISQAKAHAEQACAQLLHTFSFVPDDKLNWTPSPTAKSALRIVAHCAVANFGISRPIRNEEPEGSMDFSQMLGMMEAKELEIDTREKAIEALKASTQEVLRSLDMVESLDCSPNSLFGPMPMMFWIFLPGRHMMGHAYQVDYLQTVWGDLEFHFAGS